jgi:hypothetical protein
MKLQLLLLGVIISSCSLSEKERNETAIITCNILSETRNFQSSERIKEINSAREKLGEELFLEGNEKIIEAFKYDLCKELVLNDPDYDNLLIVKKNIEKRIIDSLNQVERERELQKAEKIIAQKKADEPIIRKRMAEYLNNIPVYLSEVVFAKSSKTIGLELFGEDISDFTGYVELTFKVNQSSIVLKFKGNKPYFDKKPYFQTEKSNIPSDALNSIEEITKKKDAISKVVLVVTGFEGTTFTLPIKKECKIYFN